MLRDLKAKIPGALNFRYGEFIKSQTATRMGIPNEPTEEQWQAIERLAVHVLQPVRDEFGPIRITSGYRSPDLCMAIGSSSISNHTRGEAADFEPAGTGVSMMEIIKFIERKLPYRELIAEYFPGGWIHVAYREGGNDRFLKLKDKQHNYSRVAIGDLEDIYGEAV